MDIVSANSLKKCGCHLSCPGDLLGFNSGNFVFDIISIVDKTLNGWHNGDILQVLYFKNASEEIVQRFSFVFC